MAQPPFFTRAVQASGPRAASLRIVALLILTTSSSAAAAQPAFRHRLEALRTRLLSNYSGHFAPLQRDQESLHVVVGFGLLAVLGLNSSKQVRKLACSVHFNLLWVFFLFSFFLRSSIGGVW